jgi:hypothetical protein
LADKKKPNENNELHSVGVGGKVGGNVAGSFIRQSATTL